MAAAGQYCYAVCEKTSQVFAWGMGENYVLGTRDDESVYKPCALDPRMFEGKKVAMMALGTQHAVALVLDTPESKIPELDTSKFVAVPSTLEVDKVRIDAESPENAEVAGADAKPEPAQ